MNIWYGIYCATAFILGIIYAVANMFTIQASLIIGVQWIGFAHLVRPAGIILWNFSFNAWQCNLSHNTLWWIVAGVGFVGFGGSFVSNHFVLHTNEIILALACFTIGILGVIMLSKTRT